MRSVKRSVRVPGRGVTANSRRPDPPWYGIDIARIAATVFEARPHESRENVMKSIARNLTFASAAIGFLLGPISAMAAGDPIRVRGTVVSIEGSALVVHSREGADVSIHLADKWGATGVVKASLSDIKPGTFIGTASLPETDGAQRAIEVVVFPEALRGYGEGHYPWDLKPKSMMTNANIANAVDGVDGRTVTLSYKGGEKKVTIPNDTPIVTLVAATAADIRPGANVFVPGERQADGTINSSVVVVGTDGVIPPM
jgi:hypothetical protein